MSIFTDNLTLYMSKESNNKTSRANKRIQQSCRTQKSVVSLYYSTEQSKDEIKKTIPFVIASSRVFKNLGINWAKKAQDLYTENYKASLKKL